MAPWINVDTTSPTQFPHQAGIDDAKFETKLVPHLIPPLNLQRRWDNNQDLPGTVADNEFEGDHPGFDGFSQTDIIGDQQIGPRHLNSPHDRIKLVVLDLDAATEWGLDVLQVGGGRSAPADSIKEGVEFLRSVKTGRVRESDLLDDAGTGFDFPDDLKLFAEAVVFNRGKGQQVLRAREVRFQRNAATDGSVLGLTSLTTHWRERT